MNGPIVYMWMGTVVLYAATTIINWRLGKKKAELEKKLSSMKGFDYDNTTDIVTVGTTRFSGDVLRFLADEANSGDTFQVLQRADGVLNITVTKSEEHEHVKKIVEDTLGKGSM